MNTKTLFNMTIDNGKCRHWKRGETAHRIEGSHHVMLARYDCFPDSRVTAQVTAQRFPGFALNKNRNVYKSKDFDSMRL